MTDNIKLLEDLVGEAVDRLGRVNAERNRLLEEIDALRERLDALEQDAARGGRDEDAEEAWRARRAQVLSMAQDALSELRGE